MEKSKQNEKYREEVKKIIYGVLVLIGGVLY